MKALLKKFYDEPVFALAIVQAACVYVIASVEDSKAKFAAGFIAAVCVVAQRQLVEPYYEG